MPKKFHAPKNIGETFSEILRNYDMSMTIDDYCF